MGKSEKGLSIGSELSGGRYKYRILNVVGKGDARITYYATSIFCPKGEVPGRNFIIKEYSNRWDIKRYSASAIDIISVAAILQYVVRHPNIGRVVDIFEANDTVYYAMEYVEGENLREFVRRRGPLSVRDTLDMLLPVMRAVVYLHDRCLLHLDIKPDNIIVHPVGSDMVRPVLIDFGQTRPYDADGLVPMRGYSRIGASRGYAPPEQCKGLSELGPAADVYALGAVLLFCLAGENPLPSDQMDPGMLREALEGRMDEKMIDSMIRALAPDPGMRTPTVRDLIRSLYTVSDVWIQSDSDSEATLPQSQGLTPGNQRAVTTTPIKERRYGCFTPTLSGIRLVHTAKEFMSDRSVAGLYAGMDLKLGLRFRSEGDFSGLQMAENIWEGCEFYSLKHPKVTKEPFLDSLDRGVTLLFQRNVENYLTCLRVQHHLRKKNCNVRITNPASVKALWISLQKGASAQGDITDYGWTYGYERKDGVTRITETSFDQENEYRTAHPEDDTILKGAALLSMMEEGKIRDMGFEDIMPYDVWLVMTPVSTTRPVCPPSPLSAGRLDKKIKMARLVKRGSAMPTENLFKLPYELLRNKGLSLRIGSRHAGWLPYDCSVPEGEGFVWLKIKIDSGMSLSVRIIIDHIVKEWDVGELLYDEEYNEWEKCLT